MSRAGSQRPAGRPWEICTSQESSPEFPVLWRDHNAAFETEDAPKHRFGRQRQGDLLAMRLPEATGMAPETGAPGEIRTHDLCLRRAALVLPVRSSLVRSRPLCSPRTGRTHGRRVCQNRKSLVVDQLLGTRQK